MADYCSGLKTVILRFWALRGNVHCSPD